MIELTRGNLLESGADALVNTVNCVGVMGRGIALQFKRLYPGVSRQYEKACKAGEVRLGRMFVVKTGLMPPEPRYIIHFPTKQHWKEKSRLENIEAGLAALIGDVERLALASIAVPPLGCGNGGLDWDAVRPLIESAFAKLPAVRLLLFPPTGAPEPENMPAGTKRPNMTLDRALLVWLLDRYAVPDYRSSKLEVQKLAYFLQVAGHPSSLNFVKSSYGPYVERLNHVLQSIEGHFIRGYGDRDEPASIRPLPEAPQDARLVLNRNARALEQVNRVARLIEGFETPYGMELLASVHWVVSREDVEAARDVEKAIEGVHAWSDRKRKLFKPAHIQKAWQRLRSEGWIGDSTVGGREAELLSKINQQFSGELRARYDDLVAKRRAESLTADELSELLDLTDRVESWEARRVEALAELSRLRNMTLGHLMKELGISAPSYE